MMSNIDLQSKTRLSQWEALTLEGLRAKGWSNEQIIEGAASGSLPTDDDSKFQFNYNILAELAAEQPQAFARAVQDGYQIKYNTIRGIHSWILIALQKEGSLILDEGKEAVQVSLTEPEAARLRSVLSYGWQLNALANSVESNLAQDASMANYEVRLTSSN